MEVAAKSGLPAQYLSDVKRGRRPMTELIARRLGGRFGVDFQWFLGGSSSMEVPQSQSAGLPATSALWLPLFPFPIDCAPRAHPQWDGAGVEVAGAAAAKLVLARHPYVLRFGRTDIQGRLMKGDLILISQQPDEDAQIHVVRHRKKSYLARAAKGGTWIRVADGTELPSSCPATGHCVGVVWSSLS